jgi:hypothetical protein
MAAKSKTEAESAENVAAEPVVSGAIVVTGPEAGRWRSGRYFCRVARTLQLAELSAEDLKQIEADPLLKINYVD